MSQVCVTLDQAVNIATDPEGQRSDAWHQHRSVRITASLARTLVTYVANKSPNWDQKMEKYFNNKFRGCEATAHGVRAEPQARICYQQRTGYQVLESGLMINPSVPWIGASHDGIVFQLEDGGSRKILKTVEFKCPIAGISESADKVLKTLSWIEDPSTAPKVKESHNYYCQVQLGLLVSNLKECDVVIYSTFDASCFIITVKYDEKLVLNEYLPKLTYVYFTHALKYLTRSSNTATNEIES